MVHNALDRTPQKEAEITENSHLLPPSPFLRLGLSGNLAGVASAERILLYRGVGSTHVGASIAENGLVRPSLPWWQFWRSASRLEHNTVADATHRSIFTSWSRNCDVGENFALRPSGSGTLIEAGIHPWRLVTSPDKYEVLLIHKPGVVVKESEILVIGLVSGTPRPVQLRVGR